MLTVIFYISWYLILIAISLAFCRRECGLNSPLFQRGYGKKTEEISVLLDRIDWSNHYKGRISPLHRNIILTMLFTPVVLIVAINAPPSPRQCLQTAFVLFILLQALYYYMEYHSEKFPHYAIDRNVNILRKRLNLAANSPPESDVTQPSWGPGHKFYYRSN